MRIGVDRAAHQGSDRVVRAGEAENDLVGRIVEREDRSKRVARKRLDTAQGLHNRDAWRVFRRWRPTRPPSAPTKRQRDAQPMNPRAGSANPRRQGADGHGSRLPESLGLVTPYCRAGATLL